jgi:hypothetical protein
MDTIVVYETWEWYDFLGEKKISTDYISENLAIWNAVSSDGKCIYTIMAIMDLKFITKSGHWHDNTPTSPFRWVIIKIH